MTCRDQSSSFIDVVVSKDTGRYVFTLELKFVGQPIRS